MAPGGRREGGHGAWVKKAPAGGEKKDEEVDFKGRIFADHLGYIGYIWVNFITTSLRPNPGNHVLLRGNHPQMAIAKYVGLNSG
jgi:hypothetical protein